MWEASEAQKVGLSSHTYAHGARRGLFRIMIINYERLNEDFGRFHTA